MLSLRLTLTIENEARRSGRSGLAGRASRRRRPRLLRPADPRGPRLGHRRYGSRTRGRRRQVAIPREALLR